MAIFFAVPSLASFSSPADYSQTVSVDVGRLRKLAQQLRYPTAELLDIGRHLNIDTMDMEGVCIDTAHCIIQTYISRYVSSLLSSRTRPLVSVTWQRTLYLHSANDYAGILIGLHF